jgi:hypothetical protein
MKVYASSGDEAGGGIEIPDPQSGGGGGSGGGVPAAAPDYSGYYAAMAQQQDAQRNAIAQQMMMQQQQQQQQQQQPQYGGGGDPWAAYAAMFAPRGPISGSVTDVGWMDALQPSQGGVTVGGQPGTPVNNPFIGGGSMARPNADYWNRQMGGGGGFNPAMVGMSDRDWATWTSLVSPQVAQQFINERLGGGGNSAGDPGTSNQGTPGYSQFADRGVFGPEDSRGFPTDYGTPQRGNPQSPQGLTGFEAYSRSQQDMPDIGRSLADAMQAQEQMANQAAVWGYQPTNTPTRGEIAAAVNDALGQEAMGIAEGQTDDSGLGVGYGGYGGGSPY